MQGLHLRGMVVVVESVLGLLPLVDLRCCMLVSKLWHHLVERLLDHRELRLGGDAWLALDADGSAGGNLPQVTTIQCSSKTRAVCTVSGVAVDEESIAVCLGSSGMLELWPLRPQPGPSWVVKAHDEGTYCVDMNRDLVATGGQDHRVRLWGRKSGSLMACLDQIHDYIVWSVRLWLDGLFTAGCDCRLNFMRLEVLPEVRCVTASLELAIRGPLRWADGLACDRRMDLLATHDEDTFQVQLWDIADLKRSSKAAPGAGPGTNIDLTE